jgi:gamma-glutamylcyclotransferase (GGCT)/AIG2-like uncharacterized protein YtfP
VFVYGTLLSGEANHRLLTNARFVATRRTTPVFQLRDLGPYPALVPGGEQAIAGEVYEIDERTLSTIDSFEGHPRFYRRTRIVLEDGTAVESYLQSPEQVEGHPLIESGNWRAR